MHFGNYDGVFCTFADSEMNMKAISIQVKNETAEKIARLPDNKKMELSHMIDLWVSGPKSVLQVMEELGEYGARQGLTKEKLGGLLKDE
ncbi:MAG: hypothetical protein PHI28_18585 [Mangrovibacterium sp.]|nr:hypothetical protein [Mangrovibacterium sp.]